MFYGCQLACLLVVFPSNWLYETGNKLLVLLDCHVDHNVKFCGILQFLLSKKFVLKELRPISSVHFSKKRISRKKSLVLKLKPLSKLSKIDRLRFSIGLIVYEILRNKITTILVKKQYDKTCKLLFRFGIKTNPCTL